MQSVSIYLRVLAKFVYTADVQKLPCRAVNQNSDITNRFSDCNFLKEIFYNLCVG